MSGRSRQATSAPDPGFATADRLHAAAIHLLRRLRAADAAAGLSAPQLSALSVVVFAGPVALGDLARAEQVRPPTITKLVRELAARGLVRFSAEAEDRRVRRVEATAKGRSLLEEGRARRVRVLAADLAALPPSDRRLLARAAALLERLSRPVDPAGASHPPSRGARR